MRVIGLVIASVLAVVGCVPSATVACTDGRVCPAGNACDDVHGICVLPEQLTSCEALADGDDCSVAGKSFGNCREGVCLPLGCGDGFRRDPEQCDGVVPVETQACTAHGFHGGGVVTCTDQCTFDTTACSGYCGDGQIDGSEVCDGTQLGDKSCTDFGFQSAPGLACSPACTYDVSGCAGFCGDNARNGEEQCDGTDLALVDNCLDLGYHSSGTVTCTAGCTYDRSQCSQYCGDEARNGDEACDGADLAGRTCTDFGYYNATTLSCSDACTFDLSACIGYCGDGTISGPEDCEPGMLGGATCSDLGYYNSAGLACTNGCRFDDSACTGYCGNRIPDGSEVCDGVEPDSCTAFGFESGSMRCAPSCGPDFSLCHAVTWQPTTAGFTQPVYATLGFAANDVHIAGANGIKHWNGSTWSNAYVGQINAMWGSAPNDIFAVGASGTIQHYDGSFWSPMTSNTSSTLRAVWGSASNDVFAVGENVYTRWNGVSWTATALSEAYISLWGSATDNVYAVTESGGVRRWNGSTWTTPFSPTVSMWAVWGTSANNVFVVGQNGTIVHYNGSAWTGQSSSTTSFLRSVWGSGPLDVYAVGDAGTIVHYNGATWSSLVSGTTDQLFTVGGSGPADIYTGGLRYAFADTTRHWDGGAWVTMAGSTEQLDDVWGVTDNEIYAVGANGTLVRWNGMTWSAMASGTFANLTGVWASSGSNLYVTTSTGEVRRYNGSFWTVEASITGTLYAIWGSGTQVFAAGTSGKVLHYNGAAWTTYTLTSGAFANDVWGSSASDVYVVMGSPGAVHRWNGSAWNQVLVGPSAGSGFPSVWGSGPNDVYIGDAFGSYKHFDGSTWTASGLDSNNAVSALWGTGPADVYAFLQYEVRHFDGFSWSRQLQPTLTSVTSAWGYNSVFAVGGGAPPILRRPRACLGLELCNNKLDDDCDGLVDCSDPYCQGLNSCTSGGLCQGWTPVACGATVNDSTLSGQNVLDSYGCDAWLEHGRERIYKLQPTTSGMASVSMTSPGKDLDLVVLSALPNGSCEPRTTGCLGASSTTVAESVSFPVQGGEAYYIVVDGFGTDAGAFTFTVTCP